MEQTHAGKPGSGPVLICYDGTGESEDALAAAAALVKGDRAVIVSVWKPILDTILAVTPGPAPTLTDLADVDDRQLRAATENAREGARHAASAGVNAEPLVVRAEGAVWEAIEAVAEEVDASLIVCGTESTGIMSALLDSMPAALVYRATRPVMVVPSTDARAERERERLEQRHRVSERRVAAR